MDPASSLPGTPAGGPLQPATPDRVNMQRDSYFSSIRPDSGHRDSSVLDKISQFNNLAVVSQAKQLERKTADAALKRAVLGREEAEAEARRYRDELKKLHKTVEEGRERERRVGERLETVMESYGRAKETHAHTQALWEKEIRRARKETFKTQSSTVKLQEELKSARAQAKSLQDDVNREKERVKAREQEAFTARYDIVGVQEQLDQAREAIKLVQQERDAFKAAAQNEEVARIAAEGRLPLPKIEEPAAATKQASPAASQHEESPEIDRLPLPPVKTSRVSLSTWEIQSSVASELEIEDLTVQVQWERQRADRAMEMVEFLKAECEMHCCPCSKNRRRSSQHAAAKGQDETRASSVEAVAEAHAHVQEDGDETVDASMVDEEEEDAQNSVLHVKVHEEIREVDEEVVEEGEDTTPTSPPPASFGPSSRKEPRRSTIFCPSEGIFRTVSEQEAEMVVREEMVARQRMEHIAETRSPTMASEPATPADKEEEQQDMEDDESYNRTYARTPSVEPPNYALLHHERTSLLSLLNAPQNGVMGVQEAHTAPVPSIRQVRGTMAPEETTGEEVRDQEDDAHAHDDVLMPTRSQLDERPHSSAASYSASTTTTKVRVRDESEQAESSVAFSEKLRTPSAGSTASFDLTDPALTPTMTREQALAKIRERRGRARSGTQGKSGTAMRAATAPTTAPTPSSSAGSSAASGPGSLKRGAAERVKDGYAAPLRKKSRS